MEREINPYEPPNLDDSRREKSVNRSIISVSEQDLVLASIAALTVSCIIVSGLAMLGFRMYENYSRTGTINLGSIPPVVLGLLCSGICGGVGLSAIISILGMPTIHVAFRMTGKLKAPISPQTICQYSVSNGIVGGSILCLFLAFYESPATGLGVGCVCAIAGWISPLFLRGIVRKARDLEVLNDRRSFLMGRYRNKKR